MLPANGDPNISELDRLLSEAKAGDRGAYAGILRARQAMVHHVQSTRALWLGLGRVPA